MKNKETGEFELLVGNGQIISGFFILALLLAVFFAMGFIVARAKYQQEPAATTSMGAAASGDARGSERGSAAAPATPPATQPVTQPANAKTGDDQPAAQPTAPAATKSVAEAGQEKAAPPLPAPAAAPEEAAQGTYWQVSAIANLDAARALQQTIKDMGLPVSLSQGPNKFIRVLVGPYSDNATMARVKTQLENAGLHPVKHAQ